MEKPQMSAEEIGSQLRKPEGENGIRVGAAMNKSNESMYDMVLQMLGLEPGDSILEIGFGNGHFIPALFEKEATISYTGLDMSETMVREAARENQDRITDGSVTLQLGRAEDMHFAADTFTKVFAVNVLYFWDEPAVTLQAIHRVLETGGQLLLAIRSKDTMLQLPFSKQGFTLYNVEEAKALMETNGFRVSEVRTETEAPRMSNDGSKMVELENICLRGIKF